MQDFWQAGFHTCALTGGEENGCDFHAIPRNKNRIDAAGLAVAKTLFTSSAHSGENKPRVSGKLAGAPGFEPRSTAPKAGVLPLHHAPVRGTLYHSAEHWATPAPGAHRL